MSITFIDKLNLRLIRVFDYIQRFNLNIRHKFDKQHIVFDAFFRLTNANINTSSRRNSDDDKLNAFFIISLIEMNQSFKNKIMTKYKFDFNWQKTIQILNTNDENVAIFFLSKRKRFYFSFRRLHYRRSCLSIASIMHISFRRDKYSTIILWRRSFKLRQMFWTNICVLIHSKFQSLFAKLFKTLFAMSNVSNSMLCFVRIYAIHFNIFNFISYYYYEFHFDIVYFIERF